MTEFSHELENRIYRELKTITEPETSALLAVSGGSDSMGLMVLFAEVQEALGMRLCVGFVNHGLRSGVEKELALVKEHASSLGIEVVHKRVPREEATQAAEGGSIQAWARQKRYALLTEMAVDQGMAWLFTGHTMDDQAETVMLRLLRGTGIDGLVGIHPIRDLEHGVQLARPLLNVTRYEIRSYLESRGMGWVEDPSNVNDRFLRVRVRKELLPLMESLQSGVSKRIATLSDDARSIADFLGKGPLAAEKIFTPLRLCSGVKIENQIFEQLPKSLWTRIIREGIRKVTGSLLRLDRNHVTSIIEHIATCNITGSLPLPRDISVFVDRGAVYIFQGPMPSSPTGSGEPVAVGAGLWKVRHAALSAIAEVRAKSAQYVDGLELRARQKGDRVYGSTRKLKEIFNRAKVPRPYRDFVPVLADGHQVVSCPGLLPSRRPELQVNWLLDDSAPFLDVDFPG